MNVIGWKRGVAVRRQHGIWWKRVGLIATQWHKVTAHAKVSKPVTAEETDIWLNDKADDRVTEALNWQGPSECTENDYKVVANMATECFVEAAWNMAGLPPPREQGM